jgi:hypothetical protein
LTASNAQNVVKIRKQEGLENNSAWKIAKEIAKKEGWRGFKKGYAIQCLTQIPRLTVVKTLTEGFAEIGNDIIQEVQKQHQNKGPQFFSSTLEPCHKELEDSAVNLNKIGGPSLSKRQSNE